MKNVIRAFLNLVVGFSLAIGLLEVILFANPTLLFRGMSLPGPVDLSLARSSYDVHFSDADVFYWRPDLVKPVQPEGDRSEARVELISDEFGFRNQPPLPEKTNVVVLGRSISLAAHLPRPWTEVLGSQTDLHVLNLAQPGAGLIQKIYFLQRYGLPRSPRWVILEIAPSLDILGGVFPSPPVTQGIIAPLIQGLWRRSQDNKSVTPTGSEIYPLSVEIPGRQVELTCCLHYMDFFSLDRESLEQSKDWEEFRDILLDLNQSLKAQSACLALLYAPTKPDIYFPLALNPEQLEPTLREAIPYRLNGRRKLEPAVGERIEVETVRKNADAGRDLVRSFAQQNNLVLIDPTEHIVQAILDGYSPFMVYDSHWNELGHEIVAKEAARTLLSNPCP